jgi:hypothetical protein
MVAKLAYKDGWEFELSDPLYTPDASRFEPMRVRRYLRVRARCTDSVTGKPTEIIHQIAVPWMVEEAPPDEAKERFLRRWLLDAIIGIERHEACEFFTLDGAKPFFPPHEPGSDPYVVRELPVEDWPRVERAARG